MYSDVHNCSVFFSCYLVFAVSCLFGGTLHGGQFSPPSPARSHPLSSPCLHHAGDVHCRSPEVKKGKGELPSGGLYMAGAPGGLYMLEAGFGLRGFEGVVVVVHLL